MQRSFAHSKLTENQLNKCPCFLLLISPFRAWLDFTSLLLTRKLPQQNFTTLRLFSFKLLNWKWKPGRTQLLKYVAALPTCCGLSLLLFPLLTLLPYRIEVLLPLKLCLQFLVLFFTFEGSSPCFASNQLAAVRIPSFRSPSPLPPIATDWFVPATLRCSPVRWWLRVPIPAAVSSINQPALLVAFSPFVPRDVRRLGCLQTFP